MGLSASDFKAGMRQLAAAVTVITTEHDGERMGMTATAVVSLTAEPPQIGIVVNRSNASFGGIASSRAFAVNVLSHGQAHLAARFAGMDGTRREDRFAGSPDWTVLSTGAPVLADAAAVFDCTVAQEVELSSHTLLVGLVQAIRTEPTTTPLLYMDGGWASLVRANKLDFKVYAEVLERLGLVIDRLVAAPADPQASLMEFVQEFATVTAAQSGVLQDFHAHETFAPSDRLDAINRRKRDVETKLARLLDEGMKAGVFDIPDPAITADAILGMLNSIYRWPDRRAMPDAETIGPAFAALTAAMVRARAR